MAEIRQEANRSENFSGHVARLQEAVGAATDQSDQVPQGEGASSEASQKPLKPYTRKVGNWLRAYLEYTAESESPETYHLWAGVSAIASAVRRNVSLDQGLYVLYPNLYIAFIGPPARTAKSTALWLARQIMYQVPSIKIGPEACSREQLIRAMAETKLDNQCAMTIHSSEFSDLIDTSGILMIQFLTSIYDGNYTAPTGWSYETKHQGKDKIINPYLNLVFGTTPSYFAESMPESIVGHGFTSRTIVVYEERERHTNSRPEPNESALGKALVDDLRHIATIRGEFKWGGPPVEPDKRGRPRVESQKVYDDYYESLYHNVPLDHRLEGFHWRKKTHVLKIAMLLSLAERDDLTIQAADINTAVQLLHDLEPSMARAFSAVGKYDHASTLERIGNQIRAGGGMPISDLYARNYFSGDDLQLERLIATLEKMGTVVSVWEKQPNGKMERWLRPTARALPWTLKPKVREEIPEEAEEPRAAGPVLPPDSVQSTS